ncbi:MAG: PmoA family protein [Candidatus Hydrogenedentes bacterium]|nr:PmoA family protein [Candidatus Hydrogenedentota bacterium]
MSRYLLTLCFAAACTAVSAEGPAPASALRLAVDQNQVSVYCGDTLFTAYKFGPGQKYPYFFPVNGPVTGKSVTTETSEPYPHHHSLFFGCDRVNGGNYWQDTNARGQIVSEQVEVTQAAGAVVSFTNQCVWRQPGHDPIIRDERRVSISSPAAEIRVIDFEITLDPLVEITIEKTNHSLFSARMAPELNVEHGGVLVNAAGQQGEEATFGQPSPWMDYSGTRDGATEGLAILQHPGNRWFPAPWFTRDYGFFSPTPMYWIEGDRLVLPKGERLTLRYRVVVHGGDAAAAGIPALWGTYQTGG